MRKTRIAALALLWLAPGLNDVGAEEVRYVEKDGVTYRVTRQTEQRPVADVTWQRKEETVYNEQFTTEMRETHRTVYTPVTEYRWQPRWHGWWNPFTQPHVAYHMVPSTRWEPRTEKIRTPISYRQVVPETRVVEVPVRSLKFVEREKETWVAVSPSTTPPSLAPESGSPAATVASRVGGISKLENDPPRQPVTVSGGTIRR